MCMLMCMLGYIILSLVSSQKLDKTNHVNVVRCFRMLYWSQLHYYISDFMQ